MFDWLHGSAGLILGFSGLIFIHELGHFALAKWNGVRVHVFSIGMGPYLVSFTWGETVYALSLIPIGGYVKLMGQDDLNPSLEQNKDPKDYRNKRPGQKAAILAAGAGFNLAFTIIAFTSCYMVGMNVEPPRIGSVSPGTPLAKATLVENGAPAKLSEGDRILEVNGVPVKTFLEAMLQISAAPNNKDLQLRIARGARPRSEDTEYVTVQTTRDKKLGASSIGLTQLTEKKVLSLGLATQDIVIVEHDPKSSEDLKNMPAAKAGLRQNDRIMRINDTVITDSAQIPKLVRSSEGKPLTFHIRRDGNESDVELTPVFNKEMDAYQIGLLPITVDQVTRVDPQSPAYSHGLRPGALIMPGDGLKWKEGQPAAILKWTDKYRGMEESAVVTATLPVQPENPEYTFEYEKQVQELYKAEGVGEAITVAWGDTLRFSGNVFSIIRGLFTRDVSPKALSGAVGISQVMYNVAANRPLMNFIWFLGFISLNLGVLQFVPIPLLDGWHLLMVAIEKFKGSPVPQKVQEAFQYVGILMVGGLLLLATYNDISRIFFNM